MRKLAIASALVLGACSNGQVAADAKVLAQMQTVTKAVCKADPLAQPVIVALAAPVATAVVPAAAPAVAGAVALDTTVIHPDIVRACAAIGATAVAAS